MSSVNGNGKPPQPIVDGEGKLVERAELGGNPLLVRLQQQAALAEFGRHAVRADDLDVLLQEAAVQAAHGLGVECAKVLELQPGAKALLVRAGVGWKPGVVGTATVGADLESPAGFALHTGKAVIAEDLAEESRFRVPRLIRDHGIRSAANVIIRGQGEPFGVLEVDSRHPQSFTADDIHFLEGFANLLAAAIERHKANALIAATAEEREVLLRELQHRIRNNLQVITSLIRLQAGRTKSTEVQQQLAGIGNRIDALRLLHEQLSGAAGAARIDLSAYLHDVCVNLFRLHGADEKGIRLDLRCPRTTTSVDTAVPLGLVVNEFIVNSLKYAFPDRPGAVTVSLEAAQDGHLRLLMEDDGIGTTVPSASNGAKRIGGLGLQLIELLTKQIGGSVAWGSGPGTRAEITFPA